MRFVEGIFDDIHLQAGGCAEGLLAELDGFRQAIDQHSLISITDAAGQITYVNEKFCATSQFAREELLGQDHRLLNSGVHSKAFFAELWKTIERGRCWHGEICNRAKDGSLYWLDTTIVPVMEKGAVRRFVAIRTDVTQHKLTAERASAVSTQLQGVLDAASEVSIISTDVRGQITMFNRGAERMFGYRAEEMVGRHFLALHVPEEVETRRCELSRRFGRELSGFEVFSAIPRSDGREKRKWTFVRKEGERLIGELVVTALRNEEDAIIGYLGMTTDITEREEQTTLLELRNAELAEARQRAEMAANVKSEFLANMSHEIRTPMTAILGFADILLGDSDAASGLVLPEQRKYLETIRRNGEHLLEILNGILDLSKIDAGCMAVERMRSSPCKLVADVSSLMRVRAEAKGLTLSVDADGPLPETIETDPLRLKQILINLVANAVKFTETGGVSVTLRHVERGGRSLLEFAVSDSGIGMSQELVQRLFRPFTQADASTTRRFGGTGLGLTISRRFANMLGGDIDVTSVPGEGSTFRVTVETGDLTGVEFTSQSADQPGQPTAGMFAAGGPVQLLPAGCTILLAEDGPDNQRLISFVLRKAGGDVTVVENGNLALEAALAHWRAGQPFDIVLMDMQMPVMDGYTATRELRAAGYAGKIIALTAHAMAGDRQRCLEAQCDDYATKPIDRNGLVELIRHHVTTAHSPLALAGAD